MACLLAVSTPQWALAQKWDSSADLKLIAGHSDNPRLETGDTPDTVVTEQLLRLEAFRKTRTLDLTVGAEAEFVQFDQSDGTDADQKLEDEENQRGNIKIAYRPNSRFTYDLYARYAHDNYSSRQAVDANTGGELDAPPGGDGSITNEQRQFRIDRLVVRPSVKVKGSRRSSYELFALHRDSDFSGNVNLSDYGRTEYSAVWSYSLSDARLDAFKLSAGYEDYTSSGIIDEDDANMVSRKLDGTGIPVKLTYIRSFKRGLYLAATAGVTQLDFEDQNIDGENETLFGIYLGNDNTEGRHRYAVSYNDFVQPNSSAVLIKSQMLRLQYSYEWNRKTKIGIQSLIFQNENLTGNSTGDEQDYFNIEPFVDFEIGRSLELRLRYRFRDFERSDGSSSEDNAFTATLKYKLWG